jgi:hypothetical protein
MITVGVNGFTGDESNAILWLLSPYKIQPAANLDDSNIIISKGPLNCSKPLIRTDSNPWRADRNYPKECDGIVEIPMELVTACSDRLQAVMNPRVALSYRLATSLPVQYNVVPSSIRNWFLRRHEIDFGLVNHIENELARRVLAEAFTIQGLSLDMKSAPSLLITHDIETRKGLEKAVALKAVEDDLNITSTWFLPSDEYPISKHIAKEVANGSTIGSHDIKHDGRLIHVRKRRDLVKRLRHSRVKLENLFEKDVHCFRSPLLQFSEEIVLALSEAGYELDFSLPCWDPVHPVTASGFGIRSLHSFKIGDITEVPLTLIQDHQLLSLLRMTPKKAAELIIDDAKVIRSYDGDIVLLVHPDYAFSGELKAYKELLTSLREIHDSLPTDRIS